MILQYEGMIHVLMLWTFCDLLSCQNSFIISFKSANEMINEFW